MITLKSLINKSSHAVCGATEREVLVPRKNKSAAIRAIKKSGTHMFIGSGPALSKNNAKIWFIRRGGF